MNSKNTQLQSNLSQFGLNPVDWKLVQEHGRVYRVEYINDSDFYFMGIRKSKNNTWDLLKLVSI